MAESNSKPEVKIETISISEPDPKQYEHLSQKERMMQGFPYWGLEPGLTQERLKCRRLVKKLNDSPDDDFEGRLAIVKELLNPASAGDTFIEPPFRIDYGYNLTVGKNCFINWDCTVLDSAEVVLGDTVVIGPGVHIYTATHPLCPIQRREWEYAKPVTIGSDVWIGGQATICPGVTIGNGVTIGAGAVVTKSFPSFCVIAGNPAKIIKYLPGYNGN